MRVEFTRNKGDGRKAAHPAETRPFGSWRGGTVSRTIQHGSVEAATASTDPARPEPTARG